MGRLDLPRRRRTTTTTNRPAGRQAGRQVRKGLQVGIPLSVPVQYPRLPACLSVWLSDCLSVYPVQTSQEISLPSQRNIHPPIHPTTQSNPASRPKNDMIQCDFPLHYFPPLNSNHPSTYLRVSTTPILPLLSPSTQSININPSSQRNQPD
jgi:hypothetical protein